MKRIAVGNGEFTPYRPWSAERRAAFSKLQKELCLWRWPSPKRQRYEKRAKLKREKAQRA